MRFELSSTWNLVIAVVGATFCLYPLIFLKEERGFTTDDYQVFKSDEGVPFQRSISLLASFFVVLIPAVDLLLDWPCHIKCFLFPDKRSSKKAAPVSHMHEFERLFFMIGMSAQASVWLLPAASDTNSVAIVYTCTDNFSGTLILGAILSYLQRCTTTFTAFRTTLIMTLAVAGQMTATVRESIRYDLPIYRVLYKLGMASVAISSTTFVYTIFLCAFRYCRVNIKSFSNLTMMSKSSVKWLIKSLSNFMRQTPVCMARRGDYDYDHELFTNIIPALHMTASLMVLYSGYYANFTARLNRRTAHERKDFIVLAAGVLVLVIELRVRKSEIARGLVCL